MCQDWSADEPAPFAVEEEIPLAPLVAPGEPAFHSFETFARLVVRRGELKDELKDIEDQMKMLTPLLRGFFAAHPGFKNIPLNGATIFPKREIHVHPKSHCGRQDVCEALRASDLGHFVQPNYNDSKLSAWVRELERSHLKDIQSGKINDVSQILPPAVALVLSTDPVYKIIGRRTGHDDD
jgi:hypothetical protein